jgi:hypothetical protein
LTLEQLHALGKDLREPKFEEAGRVHEWRNYVPDEIQALWAQLSDEARGAVYFVAEEAAGREDWD